MITDEEWLDYLRRWNAVVDGLADRMSLEELEEVRDEGIQEPFFGIGGVLGGHELGFYDLTPAEEDELWELAALNECRDEDLLRPVFQEKSVRGRPIRRVRPKHPLRGGGHGPGRGLPGKREFPAAWSDDDTMERTMDVARRPAGAVRLPTGQFRAFGERDGVLLSVLVSPAGEVLTSYPVRGRGVVQNDADQWRGPASQRLQELVETVLPAGDQEPRTSLDELMAVGEWPYVVTSLRELPLALTDEQQRELDDLAYLAGLPAS